jgi:HK97 gp10 family phage protein
MSVQYVVGVPGLLSALKRDRITMQRAVARGVTIGAFLVHKTAVDNIEKGPKTGHMYGSHQASAGGESPATDLGGLAASLRVVAARPGDQSTAQVIASAPYAQALEYGTMNMEARPFLGIAAENRAKDVAECIAEEIRMAMP